MYTENGLLVDLGQIEEIVKEADVFAVGFRLFPERLLIDTRHDPSDPDGPCALPMVAIVDPVQTFQDRIFWLGQHRPTLGVPENLMFFLWPHSVAYLEESGLWQRIRDRVVRSGFYGAADTIDAALQDLRAREAQANRSAVRGEGYQDVWTAHG